MNNVFFILDLQGEAVMFYHVYSTKKSYYLPIETWEKYREPLTSDDQTIVNMCLEVIQNNEG